jgi:hypothetical protein
MSMLHGGLTKVEIGCNCFRRNMLDDIVSFMYLADTSLMIAILYESN